MINGINLYVCKTDLLSTQLKKNIFMLRNISDICKGSLHKIILDDTIYCQISSNLECKCQKSFFHGHLKIFCTHKSLS